MDTKTYEVKIKAQSSAKLEAQIDIALSVFRHSKKVAKANVDSEIDTASVFLTNQKHAMEDIYDNFDKLTIIPDKIKIKDDCTLLDGAFAACENLIELDLSNIDFAKIQDASLMFAGCSKLNSLNLCFDASSLNTNGNKRPLLYMFDGCSMLSNGYIKFFNVPRSTVCYNRETFLEETGLNQCPIKNEVIVKFAQ